MQAASRPNPLRSPLTWLTALGEVLFVTGAATLLLNRVPGSRTPIGLAMIVFFCGGQMLVYQRWISRGTWKSWDVPTETIWTRYRTGGHALVIAAGLLYAFLGAVGPADTSEVLLAGIVVLAVSWVAGLARDRRVRHR